MGSSVRGAIDMVALLTGLARLRGEQGMARATARDAAHAALSGRIRIADGCDRAPESVIDELLGGFWPEDAPAPLPPDGRVPGDDAVPGGRGKADGLPPRAAGTGHRRASASAVRRDRAGNGARRTIGRAELSARHEVFGALSPELGTLDEDVLAELLAADPDMAVTLLADLARATDRELRAAAQRLAARIFFRLGAAGQRPARGTRRLGAGRVEGDLDLEKTLDRWSGFWPPDPGDLVTRSWRAHRRTVCLLIDHSGSMSGLAVAIAAVAAASVVLAASDGGWGGGRGPTPAIVAFSGAVTVLQAQGTRRDPAELVGDLVALRGHGMTDLAAALRAAAAQMAGAAAGDRTAVLLSDCMPTAGGDPALALAGIGRLHVLCPLPTPEAEQSAAALARRGGGVSRPVRKLTEVAPALTRVLS
jgi:uncharacterized protein with von Willebrand factor type A (vWA) domain